MDLSSLPTEIRTTHPDRTVSRIYLDWAPQPGNYLELEGATYLILERRHRYHLKRGKYALNRIVVYVQPVERPEEKSWVEGRWTIGDARCRFNARSEVIRCAVNPLGPCEGCASRESETEF